MTTKQAKIWVFGIGPCILILFAFVLAMALHFTTSVSPPSISDAFLGILGAEVGIGLFSWLGLIIINHLIDAIAILQNK